jgi:hypothetical protein
MADNARALDVLKQLVSALADVERCRFCCVAADEDCHKDAFDAAVKRAKAFLKKEREEALMKPS